MHLSQKFKYSSIDELKTRLEELDITLPFSEDTAILKQPLVIGDKLIPNRMVIHPMEGADGTAEGKPTALTHRRYLRFSRGGAGLLWFEATSVVEAGKANPRQLLILKKNIKDLSGLLQTALKAAVNRYGSDRKPYTVLQLTHSGRYSRPFSKPMPIIAAKNPYLDSPESPPKNIITDEQLEDLEDRFAEAAAMAGEIGFDAVDIKSCHRYLISELLSARTRGGPYGGSFQNRTRFLLNIFDKIRSRCRDSIDIVVRLNGYDGIPYPYGWGVDKENHHGCDLSEPLRLVQILRSKAIKLINISSGNPYYNPHIGRPYDSGPYVPPENQLYSIERMLEIARTIQKTVPEIPIVATGFSWLREFGAACAAGGIRGGWFQLAGFGRQAFAYPDFAEDVMKTGKMERKKCCIACSKCTELMRLDGVTGCVIRDAEVYRPIYKKLSGGSPSLVGKDVGDHV